MHSQYQIIGHKKSANPQKYWRVGFGRKIKYSIALQCAYSFTKSMCRKCGTLQKHYPLTVCAKKHYPLSLCQKTLPTNSLCQKTLPTNSLCQKHYPLTVCAKKHYPLTVCAKKHYPLTVCAKKHYPLTVCAKNHYPLTVCAKNIFKTSPNNILEEFFLFNLANFMQFSLAHVHFY